MQRFSMHKFNIGNLLASQCFERLDHEFITALPAPPLPTLSSDFLRQT